MPGSSRRVAIALTLAWLVLTAWLILRNSAWAPIATVGFVVSIASCRRRPRHSAPSRRPLLHLACAGALIDLTLLAAGTQRQVAAGFFIALSAAIILARSSPEQQDRVMARHRRMSLPVALLLALLRSPSLGRWPLDD